MEKKIGIVLIIVGILFSGASYLASAQAEANVRAERVGALDVYTPGEPSPEKVVIGSPGENSSTTYTVYGDVGAEIVDMEITGVIWSDVYTGMPTKGVNYSWDPSMPGYTMNETQEEWTLTMDTSPYTPPGYYAIQPVITYKPSGEDLLSWGPGTRYEKGDEVEYDSYEYRCLREHTSREEFTPPETEGYLWKDITYTLEQDLYTFRLEIAGEVTKYTLNLSSEIGGGTVPLGGELDYSEGLPVDITAVPDIGYEFTGWTGDVTGSSKYITVTMDSDKKVRATFKKENVTESYDMVSRVSPSGSGTVSPSSGNYGEGSTVTVSAEPASSYYEFDYWSGDASGTSSTIDVYMDEDKKIVANFKEKEPPESDNYTVDTEVRSGEGTIDIHPYHSEYEAGTEIVLTASPDDGYHFLEWGGDISGSSEYKTVTVNQDLKISASFEKDEPDKVTLTINNDPIEGGGVDLAQSEQRQYVKGETVSFQAYPNDGWKFKEWTGDAYGTSKFVTLTMDEDKRITANYEKSFRGWMMTLPGSLLLIGIIVLVIGVILVTKSVLEER